MPALQRPRQEDNDKFEDNSIYIVSSRPVIYMVKSCLERKNVFNKNQ